MALLYPQIFAGSAYAIQYPSGESVRGSLGGVFQAPGYYPKSLEKLLHQGGIMPDLPFNPAKTFSGDPVQELYCATDSMTLLIQSYEKQGRHGEANLIELLRRQIQTATEYIDSSQHREAEQ